MEKRIHFSKTNIPEIYESRGSAQGYMKPAGFWYSVQSDEPGSMGWAEWCHHNSFLDIGASCPHVLDINMEEILRITSPDMLSDFDAKHLVRHEGNSFRDHIDWKRVGKEFKGIEIAPYQWRHRMDMMWYYGWDCASGVIWDVSAVKSIEVIPLHEVPMDPDVASLLRDARQQGE